jgi:predicted nucleotidyltransferase
METLLKNIDIAPVLHIFKDELKRLYGNNLKNLILFGSYARGDFKQESDVDVLIVLQSFSSVFEEIDRMSHIKYQLLLDYGVVLSTIVATQQDFMEKDKAIFRNIKKEGMIV